MLLPGDLAPDFRAPSSVNPNFHFDTAAGRYIVLSFFATSTLPYSADLLAELERRHQRFDVTNAVFFGVSIDPQDAQRLTQQWPGVMYFWDVDRQVSKLYGLLRPNPSEPAPASPDSGGPPAADASAAEEAASNSDSASLPCEITNSRDARRSVESRCAIAKTVRPAMSRSSASWIWCSVSVSTLLVASSRMRIRGSCRIARAIEIR